MRKIILTSCPSRGTWIEIRPRGKRRGLRDGRAPRGARGLKLVLVLSLVMQHLVVPLAGHVD